MHQSASIGAGPRQAGLPAASARPADITAHDVAGHSGGDAGLAALHDRLTAFLATRPGR